MIPAVIPGWSDAVNYFGYGWKGNALETMTEGIEVNLFGYK